MCSFSQGNLNIAVGRNINSNGIRFEEARSQIIRTI
jgi:hypothetical protein